MAYNKEYDQIPLPKLIKALEDMTDDLEYDLRAKRIPSKKKAADNSLRFFNSLLGKLKEYETIEKQLIEKQLKLL